MLCFFCIPVGLLVSWNSAIFYMIFSLFLLIVFKYFLLLHLFIVPKLSFAADFNMFCKFFHSFSVSTSFSFVLFKWSFTLWVYSHLMLSSFNNLTLKNSSCFNGAFLFPLFEETSGYVRSEWVNKWPNSMTDIWWWWYLTEVPPSTLSSTSHYLKLMGTFSLHSFCLLVYT